MKAKKQMLGGIIKANIERSCIVNEHRDTVFPHHIQAITVKTISSEGSVVLILSPKHSEPGIYSFCKDIEGLSKTFDIEGRVKPIRIEMADTNVEVEPTDLENFLNCLVNGRAILASDKNKVTRMCKILTKLNKMPEPEQPLLLDFHH